MALTTLADVRDPGGEASAVGASRKTYMALCRGLLAAAARGEDDAADVEDCPRCAWWRWRWKASSAARGRVRRRPGNALPVQAAHWRISGRGWFFRGRTRMIENHPINLTGQRVYPCAYGETGGVRKLS